MKELTLGDLRDLIVDIDQVFPDVLQALLEAFHLLVRLNELHEFLLAQSPDAVFRLADLHLVLVLELVERSASHFVVPDRL